MPRADGGSDLSGRDGSDLSGRDGSDSPAPNPVRRSRFSLPWAAGGGGEDEMDSGLNDRLLADGGAASGDELLPSARSRLLGACTAGLGGCGGAASAADGKRRKACCGCCAGLVLLLFVYGVLLYRAYSGLVASLPGLLIQPVKISGFCDEEIVAHGRVTMVNQASWAVDVTVQSTNVSLPGGPVAFSMRSADRMSFAGDATTVQDAVQHMVIEDPRAAGRLVQDFAVLGTVNAHVEVQMVVEVSLLPGAYSYPYKAEHTFSSLPAGPEAAIPGCRNGTTVQQQAIHRLTVLQNDPSAARTEMAVSVAWYNAWSFTAEFPPTEWRLVNKLSREPIAYVAVPAAALRRKSARAATSLNASIPREFAVAAGDAFRRTMDLSELSVEMVGTGQAGDASGQCQRFAKLLQNFVYPVYVWDAAANATYNRDPYAPAVNPCKRSQVEHYVDALVDVTSVEVMSSNGSHAWLKVTVSANVTDGLGKVGTTAKLALLNSTKIPPMRVSLQRPDGSIVMTSTATFDGCLGHFQQAPHWCKQASATIMIDDAGTGMAMDDVISDFIASEVTNFTMRISGIDAVKAARASAVLRNGDPVTQLPTVLATVAGAYPQPVHVDLVSKGLNGTRARIDNAQINYTDHDGFSIRVSPRYPAPIVVSGQYNDTVQRRLYAQWLQINAGTISLDVRCGSESVGSGTAHLYPGSGRDKFPLVGQVNVEDALNSRCLGGTTAAWSSDGDDREQPPFQFFARIAPHSNAAGSDAKPFLFNSSYGFANSSDGSMDLNLSRGLLLDSLCHSPAHATLTTSAPDFLTILGDIDVTAQTGDLVYEGQVGATLDVSAGSGPHVEVRGDKMVLDLNLRVDNALVIGSMINTWYATWHDLVFQLTGTEVSIVSAPTNPIRFSHTMNYIKKDYSYENTASLVTDVVTSWWLEKSTDAELEATADVLFNLTDSVLAGWGFAPFDITVPRTYFDVVTYGPEGYLNYSFAMLKTSPFPGFHGTDSLIPALTVDTKDAKAAARWVGAFVNNTLGCMHHPWRTLEENQTLSIQLVGDTTPAYQDQCVFQAMMEKVSYPLISFPYSDNATTEPYDVRVERLQLTTYVNEAVPGPDVELVLVLDNATHPSIRNVIAGLGENLPPFNLMLNGQLEVQKAKSELLRGRLTFDQNRFHGMASAALAVSTSDVGQLLDTLVETSLDNISVDYSFDVQPGSSSQGLLASVLHSAAEAASSCLLGPAPTPAPAPMPAQTSVVEKVVARIASGLGGMLALAEDSADPLAGVDVDVEVQTTSNTLAVIGRVNITAEAAPLTRLLGNESVRLSYGELGVDVYHGAENTGDVIGSPAATMRLVSLSTEEVAVKINTSAGAAMDAASQLGAEYLMKPRVNAIARVVLRGQSDKQGNGLAVAHKGYDAHSASSSGLSNAPEVDVDIDVRFPGAGVEFPCDPKPPTPTGTCSPLSGYPYSFSPVDGVCVYVGAGLSGLQIVVTAVVQNPLPLPFTLENVHLTLHAVVTDSAGTPTNYNTIATASLPKPVVIPAHSDGTMVTLPCSLDKSVSITTAGLLYLAYEADRLSLSVGGPDARASCTISVSAGRYKQGVWTPAKSSEPVHLTLQLNQVYKALVSVDECANTGRHFTDAECPSAKCNVASPPAECLVAKCGITNCGLGNSGCGISCTSRPGCAHAKTNGRGTSETCSCQPGYCVAISPGQTKTCAKNLGAPLPESCHGTATDGSCRYTKSCSSWRGPSGSVECKSGRCVCSMGYCHDGKGRCMPVPHNAGPNIWIEEPDLGAVLRAVSGL